MRDSHASRVTRHSSSRLLDNFNNSPALSRGQRSGLDYSHDVARVRADLVVRHELGSTPNVASVFAMLNLTLDTHNYGFLHLVAGDQPDLLLPAMPRRRARSGTIHLGRRVAEDLHVGLSDRIRDLWID